MWQVYTFIMHWANCLDRQGWMVVLTVGMGLGFFCIWGIGSRH
jgi:hypothetical protein